MQPIQAAVLAGEVEFPASLQGGSVKADGRLTFDGQPSIGFFASQAGEDVPSLSFDLRVPIIPGTHGGVSGAAFGPFTLELPTYRSLPDPYSRLRRDVSFPATNVRLMLAEPPVLIEPAAATTFDLKETFRWTAVPDATRYELGVKCWGVEDGVHSYTVHFEAIETPVNEAQLPRFDIVPLPSGTECGWWVEAYIERPTEMRDMRSAPHRFIAE